MWLRILFLLVDKDDFKYAKTIIFNNNINTSN